MPSLAQADAKTSDEFSLNFNGKEPQVNSQDNTRPRLVFFGNEFPTDDLKDLFRRLLRHSRDRRFRVLAAFLEESTVVLKDEVSKLPRPLKDLVPHFANVLTLVEHGDFRQGPLGAAIESALLTVLELGMLIGYVPAS
jgi:asperthecin polyketide synthase